MKREEEKTSISLIWLENRRTFSFNSNYTGNTPNLPTNNTSGSGPFVTKAFHLNFIPSGRQSFLLISADNSIEVFIQNSQNFSVDFDIFKLKVENLTGILSGSFAYQRPNGTVLIVLKSEALWSVLRLSEDFELEEIYRQAEKPSGKFIWSESKEILIKLELENCGKSLKVSNYNFSTVTAKSIDLPFAMEKAEEIFHSSRASNYLFLQSKSKNVLLLNLSGESVKQLCLEADLMNFDTENLSDSLSDHLDSSLVISPNGLVIAKLSYSFDDNFPIIIYSPIGEISLKSKMILLPRL